MKTKIILILSIAWLLLSCDRFDREFSPQVTINEFTESFVNSGKELLTNGDIAGFMAFYSSEYLNNGTTKTDLENYFLLYDWSESVIISLSQISTLSFNVTISDATIDVHDTWVDFARMESGNYFWIGNGSTPIDLPKQIAIAQSFTGLWCSNCPEAAAELQRIESLYPDNFIYLKYHMSDALQMYNNFSDEHAYYGRPNPPTTIFQGQQILTGTSSAVLSAYQVVVEGILTDDAYITIEDVTFSVGDLNVEGSVSIFYEDFDINNLYLHYLVFEKEKNNTYTHGGAKATNVVRARGKHLLDHFDSGERFNFELELLEQVDDNAYLVIWVQRMENTSGFSEGDGIFNAIKIKL